MNWKIRLPILPYGGRLTQLNTAELTFLQNPVWSRNGNILPFNAITERNSILPETKYGFLRMNLNTSEHSAIILPGIHDYIFDSDWSLCRLVWAQEG